MSRKQVEQRLLDCPSPCTAGCSVRNHILTACPIYITETIWAGEERIMERHQQQNYMRFVPFRTGVHCWLLMQDEVGIAALVLAARGHMLLSAKSLPTDTARLNSLAVERPKRVRNGIPLPACVWLNCPCTASIALCPVVSGCWGFN